MGKARAIGARTKPPGAPAGAGVSRTKPNPNPFEVKVNRQKFQVLGRKMRHDVGMPGVSRARAIQKVSGEPIRGGRPLPGPRVRSGTAPNPAGSSGSAARLPWTPNTSPGLSDPGSAGTTTLPSVIFGISAEHRLGTGGPGFGPHTLAGWEGLGAG